MTEAEAHDWVLTRFGAAAHARLQALAAIVHSETTRQNLVASSTFDAMWSRHLVDSAQLLDHVELDAEGLWLDIGSGAGFPGLVIALLCERSIVLVEPRRKRAAFLVEAVVALGVTARVEVRCASVEALSIPAAIISARAVSSLSKIFEWGAGCTIPSTRWFLPKGRTAREEVVSARAAWHGVFHVEQSITDPDSLIVLASGVSRR